MQMNVNVYGASHHIIGVHQKHTMLKLEHKILMMLGVIGLKVSQ
jgi:hypothetical protein